MGCRLGVSALTVAVLFLTANQRNEADTMPARSIREARSSCPAARVPAEGMPMARVAGLAPRGPASGLPGSRPQRKTRPFEPYPTGGPRQTRKRFLHDEG